MTYCATAKPKPGKLEIGPLRDLSRAAIETLLAKHGLSLGARCRVAIHRRAMAEDATVGIWLVAKGANVTGYLFEAGSEGLEAYEESIDDFLCEAALPGHLLRISGEYFPADDIRIQSFANYLRDAGGFQSQMQRVRHAHGTCQSLQTSGGPILVPASQSAASTDANQAAPRAAIAG